MEEDGGVANNYKNLDIDGHVIKKKAAGTVAKGKMNIGNYRKMKEEKKKEMQAQEEEDDDDYQPLKKQKTAPVPVEDEDDDYKISLPSKPAKTDEEDDDEYQIPVKKTNIKQKPKSKSDKKKASPFITDPYKHMKLKKKKNVK